MGAETRMLAEKGTKLAKDPRFQVAVLAALGFGLVVGLYQGVVAKKVAKRTTSEEIAYLFEAIWEAAFFGFGLGFFIIYGYAIRKIEKGPLRNRCIGIWLALSYFFMSWWPHASAHQFLTPANPSNFIILEMCFHWPNLAAAFVLCFYQFDVLLISYDVAKNNKDLRFWTKADEEVMKWYKNPKVHALVIALLAAPCWAVMQWKLNPYPPTANSWQRGLFFTIFVVDGLSSGIGMGFSYAAGRLIHRLPKRRTRIIGAVSATCIGFLLVIATPHPIVHHHYAFDPIGTLYVEYFFHLSITGAVAVLGYYQHRFLVLAIKGRMGMMLKFKHATYHDSTTDVRLSKLNNKESSSSFKESTSAAAESFSVTMEASNVSGVTTATPEASPAAPVVVSVASPVITVAPEAIAVAVN